MTSVLKQPSSHQCQETLVQFGTFLSISLSIDDYSGRLPSLEKLIMEYNLSADVAFFLVRPMISHKITVRRSLHDRHRGMTLPFLGQVRGHPKTISWY